MHLLVGLGNPGRRYASTRHNIGFMVIEAIAEKALCRFEDWQNGNAFVAAGTLDDQRVSLLKPQTYMNNSGFAVSSAIKALNISPDRLLVITDDFQLPIGALRLRQRGSSGGHNGLQSVIDHLGTTEFPRLRCGIGGETIPNDKSLMKEYVLSRFEEHEKDTIDKLLLAAVDMCRTFVVDGALEAMSRHNTRKI